MDILRIGYGLYHLYIFRPRLTLSGEHTSDFSYFRNENKMIKISSKKINMAKKCKVEPSCSYESQDDNDNDDDNDDDNEEDNDEDDDDEDDDEDDDNDDYNDEDDESAVQCTDVRKDCCYSKKCGKPDMRPPYAVTLPENRRYGLVISHSDPSAEEVDMAAIMGHLFVLFEECVAADLKFSDCTPMATFCSNLLIVCDDDDTVAWMIEAISGVCPPHCSLPFIKFFGLVKASFVLPLIVPDKLLCAIFEQLELQNCGIETHKWSVVGRYPLDPCADDFEDKVVSHLCDNDEILLYIDVESRDYIIEHCSKLKYCFWRLTFEFDCS